MKKISQLYSLNKEAKVGDKCICPACSTEFVKVSYQQAFCKTKSGTRCKDKYWNTVIPTKRNNTTRISPASKRWLQKMEVIRDGYYNPDDYEHPFSSEALGQD